MRALVLALSSLTSLAACSRDAEPGACLRERDSACVAYDRTTAAAGRSKCMGYKWIASCPTENRLGMCTNGPSVETIYGGPPNQFTPALAKQSCEAAGGVFH